MLRRFTTVAHKNVAGRCRRCNGEKPLSEIGIGSDSYRKQPFLTFQSSSKLVTYHGMRSNAAFQADSNPLRAFAVKLSLTGFVYTRHIQFSIDPFSRRCLDCEDTFRLTLKRGKTHACGLLPIPTPISVDSDRVFLRDCDCKLLYTQACIRSDRGRLFASGCRFLRDRTYGA